MSCRKPVRKPFWRWRSNPLRRREDRVEAWVVSAVWAVAAVGGTTAGLVTAHAADEAFAQQRAARHAVHAVLLTDVANRPPALGSPEGKVWATVRWTASDGSARTGGTLVDTGLGAGSRVVVWQDGHGTLATAPPSPAAAAAEAAVLGAFAGLCLTGTVHAVGAVTRWRLDQRRVEAWGREWDLVGPMWGHRTG
ncbi:Rv1733c family protein [Streptomyces sp. NPDC058891]|uniref:Rv1733c family protein n=1 Tax=Streptomyces sp. NPDC058891 TaxID=3346667 RepID=UPI00368B43FC